jgi:hypothetical protein
MDGAEIAPQKCRASRYLIKRRRRISVLTY